MNDEKRLKPIRKKKQLGICKGCSILKDCECSSRVQPFGGVVVACPKKPKKEKTNG